MKRQASATVRVMHAYLIEEPGDQARALDDFRNWLIREAALTIHFLR